MEYNAKVKEDRFATASTPTHTSNMLNYERRCCHTRCKDWDASVVKIQVIAHGKSERPKQKDLDAEAHTDYGC